MSLLVRAATQRLLDVDEGCPVTSRYLAKEIIVLRELERRDCVQLCLLRHATGLASAQVLSHGTPYFDMYEFGRDTAAIAYQQLGSLLWPWETIWQTQIADINTRLKERANKIADTKQTPSSILKLIKKYEDYIHSKESSKNGSK